MAQSPRWYELAEQTSTLGIRILFWCCRRLGFGVFRAAALPVLFFYWITNPRLRAALADYHRRVRAYALAHPERSAPPDRLPSAILSGKAGAAAALAHLERFAEAVLDKLIVLAGLDMETRRLSLEIQGAEIFERDGPKDGCILLTSHAGCQELLAERSSTATAHELVVLQYTKHAERFNELLHNAGARPPKIHFYEVGALTPALAMELADRVADGAYVVLAGDRTPVGSQQTARVPFLGDEASFPTGGALLALLLQCPLRMMTCTRLCGDPQDPASARYRVRFRSIDEAPLATRRTREQWLAAKAADYAQALEREIVESPEDWFNFFDFWGR